jgi:hypothetical protein
MEQTPSAKRPRPPHVGVRIWILHGGKRERQERLNVDSRRFHEGRDAGKIVPRGRHRLVSRKRKVNRKE